MKTSIGMSVAAPPELVFALAQDVTRWPDLLPHYRSARVERTDPDGRPVVRFIAVRPGLVRVPVAWRSRTWSEPDACRLRFIHLGGATRTMDVTWRIEPVDGGCRVTIDHDFPAPWPWAALVDRLFTRPIAGRTLATFRAIAEAIAATDGPLITRTGPMTR